MPVQATVFSVVMQHVPWGVLDRAGKKSGADKRVRDFSLRSHLAAMVVAQLSSARSLREVEATMAANAKAFSRIGIDPAAKSTLADANRLRPAEIFEALVAPLLACLPRKLRQDLKDVLRLMDATPIQPGPGAADWARFQKRLVGAKIHVVYDPDERVPVFFHVSAGNCNDITVAKTVVPIETGTTYVFDLGYYDYGFWAKLHAAGCRFVTRVKYNTPLTEIESRPVPPGTAIRGDRIVTLPKRQTHSRKNPFSGHGREVVVEIDSGKTIALFTNDLTSPAETIAELYKTRWKIEIFFRWIKQNLRIRKFLGCSRNAVRIQVAVAMLAYIILYIIHAASNLGKNIQTFTAVIRQNLFHRMTVGEIADRITRKRRSEKHATSPQLVLL